MNACELCLYKGVKRDAVPGSAWCEEHVDRAEAACRRIAENAEKPA